MCTLGDVQNGRDVHNGPSRLGWDVIRLIRVVTATHSVVTATHSVITATHVVTGTDAWL